MVWGNQFPEGMTIWKIVSLSTELRVKCEIEKQKRTKFG